MAATAQTGRRQSSLGFDDLKMLALPQAEDRDDWDPVKRDARIKASRKDTVVWDTKSNTKQVIKEGVAPATVAAPVPAPVVAVPPAPVPAPAGPMQVERPAPRKLTPLTFGLDSGDLTVKVLYVEEGPYSVMTAFPSDSESMFTPKPGTALELAWGSKRVKVYYPGASACFEGLGASVMAFIKTE